VAVAVLVLTICLVALWLRSRRDASPRATASPPLVATEPERAPLHGRALASVMRVLFVDRSADVLTIDGVAADDEVGLFGPVECGAPVTMELELQARSALLEEILVATVDRWAADEAVIAVEICDGRTGPSVDVSTGGTHLRFGLCG
jgi:hypothetical protein